MERNGGNPGSKEKLKPIRPTLFLCTGTSGAGLSTAIENVTKLGAVCKPSTQFTTRNLRPNEKHGEQYFSVPINMLDKIPGQIALRAKLYNNIYGFFYPGIHKMRRMLESQNVIVDSLNTREEWRAVMGDNANIVSIYFSPNSPVISMERIISRAKGTGAELTRKELSTRMLDSSQYIKRIKEFDYWLDTTNFNDVLPILQSIIDYHSFGNNIPPMAILVNSSHDLIENLIKKFSDNPLK